MEILLIYFLGWFLFSVGYYIYNVYIDRNKSESKKLIMYDAFKFGLWSWIGIILMMTFGIVMIIAGIDEYISEKLNK